MTFKFKKQKEKIPNRRVGESKQKRKKGKKIPNQGSKENRRNMQKGLLDPTTSEQIQSYYQVKKKDKQKKKKKKGNHDLKFKGCSLL